MHAVGQAVLAILCKLVWLGTVDVVLGEPPAVAAVDDVAQLAQRSECAQRRVAVHGHGVRPEVLLAVHCLVRPPKVGLHRRAVHRRLLAVLLPEGLHTRRVEFSRLGEVRLRKERRGHDEPVAVVFGRVVIRVAKRARLGVVAARGRRERIAHKLQERLARKAKVPGEARLDDARAERVLVFEVRRRQVGGRHRVLGDEAAHAHAGKARVSGKEYTGRMCAGLSRSGALYWAVAEAVGGVVAAHVGGTRLLRNVPATNKSGHWYGEKPHWKVC